MKLLKLNHTTAQAILRGGQRCTWRLSDDKDLRVGDDVELVDKIDPSTPSTWQIVGIASLTKVTETRLGDITPEEAASPAAYESPAALLAELRSFYGDTVTSKSAVKIIWFDFEPMQPPIAFKLPAVIKPPADPVTEVKMFSDGGSRGNPGPSASGYVLLDMDDKLLAQEGIYLGVTTNNQAEYLGLKSGLEAALKLGARTVHVHMDSMLVVNQMRGLYKVKNRDLWAIHDALQLMLLQFKKVTFVHVPREYNKLADKAVNDALDAALATGPSPKV